MFRPKASAASLFERAILTSSARDALRKLSPAHLWRNPVMFVVEVGSALTTVLFVRDLLDRSHAAAPLWFTGAVTAWLWFTVVFANFAEAVAEGRGKAQAETLRRMRKETTARRLVGGAEERVPSSSLRKGDLVVAEAGDVIPGDGEIIEGIASVDESAITGESAPVIRESGGDRSAVTGGTRVLSDRIVVRIGVDPGQSFLDRMIGLVEGAARQKTPNELALHILLVGLTLVFLFACVTLVPLAKYSGVTLSGTVIVALLVCLIPTTIGGLLSAIGIAGMDRLLQRNVIATSGRAVEASGDVDTLLLDKTGTITHGNRMATEVIPLPGGRADELALAACLASQADETPEGRSIVTLVEKKLGLHTPAPVDATFVPFSAETRMSGVDAGGRAIRKGAVAAIARHVEALGGDVPAELRAIADRIGDSGGTPLAVADGPRLLGVIHLKDIVKAGIAERFARFRAMGIRTVMITGDNPHTAAAIAKEAGVDDFLAEATPEAKMRLIKEEQAKGKLVAMTGDGTNDAPALAQADVGVAEQRHPGRQGGRQHGRPRLESHEAPGDRRGRQAAAHDARHADHVLDRQRRGQVLRDPAGAVHGGVPRDRAAERDAPGVARERHPLRGHLQRRHHRAAHPAGVAGREVPAPRRGGDLAALAAALRRGRAGRPVRGHQARRPRARSAALRLIGRTTTCVTSPSPPAPRSSPSSSQGSPTRWP
jgi:K+-transporting ATPase ATPase B chain